MSSSWLRKFMGVLLLAILTGRAALATAESEAPPEHQARLAEKDRLWDEAQKLRAAGRLAEALALRRQVLGEAHEGYANLLVWLGWLHEHLDEGNQAEPLYRQALAIRKQVLGEQHPQYATALDNLAGVYQRWGDVDRAEPLRL